MANEKRLIAFDPITFESFARHSTTHREPDGCQYDMGYVDAFDQIDDWLDANTVDAEPVVHGHWVKYNFLGHEQFVCSECQTLGSPQWKRCPVCEAKMDGDGNG